ncbi:hypothetical protein ACWGK1_30550 [Streptomyces wedmorensis]
MTGFQAFPAGTTEALRNLDPYRFPAALVHDLPEWRPTICDAMEPDGSLPSTPGPAERASASLDPSDRRRLELHAALTAVGIAPAPGDLDAIADLCRLGDSTLVALRRWIGHAV